MISRLHSSTGGGGGRVGVAEQVTKMGVKGIETEFSGEDHEEIPEP